MNPILKIDHASFTYKGGPKILDDIDLEVRPGEILAILGPNGAGKTTLLRCMMDMLHWNEGASYIEGEDIRSIPAARLWRRMAYVPQAKSAATSYTVFQTVLLGRSSHIGAFASPSKRDIKITERVIADLGISELSDKPCHAISGGELQMALIARAMAAEPEILVLDEPESNLDFKNQLIVLDAMSELAANGVACIFNTHYPAHALQRADKSLILCKGSGSVFGSTSKVVTEENIRKAFGVNAVIGEVETSQNILRSVMPLSVAESDQKDPAQEDSPSDGKTAGADRLASITIISESNDQAGKINELLGEYNHIIIGRMGQPYRRYGLYIINVNLDGPVSEIDELLHRLGILPGISAKTTYGPEAAK